MKKIILAVTVLTLAAAGMQTANAGGVHFGLSIGLPVPVIVAPPVTYVAPPPPVVYEAPAYCPPPVVVYRSPAYYPPPVCYAPAPVIGFRFSHGERWGHERWEHHHGGHYGHR